jgi:hydrogenase nickel incorporation protein HypA/HybF
MHELALSRAIIDAALRHADGHRISAVHVRVGSLRQVVPESLAFYFEIVARETACEEARLELEPVSALLRCVECGQEWDPAPAPLAVHGALPGDGLSPSLTSFACADCGGAGEVLAGGELEVEWIEVDDSTAVGAKGPAERSR